MRKALLAFFSLIMLTTWAQKPKAPPKISIDKSSISRADLQHLKLVEDTLSQLAEKFTNDTIMDNRRKACYAFIPKMVHALKAENSFYYKFDSLDEISRIYPPDSSFRIFTWQLFFTIRVDIAAKYSRTGRDTFYMKPEIRYYGFIQMRSKDLKLYPLYDAGDTLSYGTQQVLGPNNWWGQLYYNIVQKSGGGKNYYTLMGFEAADLLTRRKIIDILTFDKDGKPKFGAPVFYFKYDDSLATKKYDTLSRFFIEYKWNAATTLNYDKQLEMIVFDHVAPPKDAARGATFTYVPDGTYEGFLWMTNHWQWVEKVFTFAINENDNPPIPVPLFGQPKRQPEMPKEVTPHE